MAEPELVIDGLTKRYGSLVALDGVSLTVHRGECVSLVGPSGCGKTTLLNCIAGFVLADAGTISLGGRSLDGVPEHRRDAAMVFQSYALFPHLSAFENVAFGLRLRKVKKADLEERVRAALALVRLDGRETSYPGQLSGGQQQRVALARALVLAPRVLLLDEPLSNLDARLRESMRFELREIQQRSGTTTVFVTHDIQEAFVLSDRVAVMYGGRIEQIGTAADVYEHAASDFVVRFVGPANGFPGRVERLEGDVVEVAAGRLRLRVRPGPDLADGAPVTVFVRPERVDLALAPSRVNSFPGRVEAVAYLGGVLDYQVRLDGHLVRVQSSNRGSPLPVGTDVHVEWEVGDAIAHPVPRSPSGPALQERRAGGFEP